jgi:hypothetical protein
MKRPLLFTPAMIALFLALAIKSHAIEGLQLSIQGSNVVLSWPSAPGESYIVEYRPALDSSVYWQQLTNEYPADTSGSNITQFVDSNAVIHVYPATQPDPQKQVPRKMQRANNYPTEGGWVIA